MPPKQSNSAAPRGRPSGSKNKAPASTRVGAANKSSAASANTKAKGKQRAQASESPEPRPRQEDEDASMEVDDDDDVNGDDDDDEEPDKTIPPDLLTRILHEFFENKSTRITKDANNAMAKYMDVFVKEAIARAAAERTGGFLEVEDLEKIAPQLLLDL